MRLLAGAAPDPACHHARRLLHRPEGLIAALEVFGLAEMPDTREAIRGFIGELRWIVRAEDPASEAIARQVAELRPHTDLHRLPGVSCDLLLEAPRELRVLV